MTKDTTHFELPLFLLVLSAFLVSVLWNGWWLALVAGVLCLLSWRTSAHLRPAIVLITMLTAANSLLMSVIGWPLVILVPLLGYGLIAWRIPTLRPVEGSLLKGRLSIGWIAAFSAASTFALVAWVWLLEPDLDRYREFVPDLPLPLLLLGALVFPVCNALYEELLFRGVIQRTLETKLRGLLPVVIQALIFGAIHYRGFPSGFVGAVLAGGWGLGLGLLRRGTGGLLTPIVAHIAADLAIFIIILLALCTAP